jgi:hypothetical protein
MIAAKKSHMGLRMPDLAPCHEASAFRFRGRRWSIKRHRVPAVDVQMGKGVVESCVKTGSPTFPMSWHGGLDMIDPDPFEAPWGLPLAIPADRNENVAGDEGTRRRQSREPVVPCCDFLLFPWQRHHEFERLELRSDACGSMLELYGPARSA